MTMNLERTEVIYQVQTNPVGPGQQLRQVREHYRLTLAEVAAQLYLRTDVIAKLEADEYHDLPSFVFVRGYLRAYAKLLKISGKEVIAQFDAMGLTESQPEKLLLRPSKVPPLLNKLSKHTRLLVIGASLVLLALILWAFIGASEDPMTTSMLPEPINLVENNEP